MRRPGRLPTRPLGLGSTLVEFAEYSPGREAPPPSSPLAITAAAGRRSPGPGRRRGRVQGGPADRSLADFAKLVELFDDRRVSFVSVTQVFNTTTSMGRLTLNVLLSFAQSERGVTGERIRDESAASKKKGLWMGGVVSLGYRVEDRALHRRRSRGRRSRWTPRARGRGPRATTASFSDRRYCIAGDFSAPIRSCSARPPHRSGAGRGRRPS